MNIVAARVWCHGVFSETQTCTAWCRDDRQGHVTTAPSATATRRSMFFNKKSEKHISKNFLGLNRGAKQARNTRGVTIT